MYGRVVSKACFKGGFEGQSKTKKSRLLGLVGYDFVPWSRRMVHNFVQLLHVRYEQKLHPDEAPFFHMKPLLLLGFFMQIAAKPIGAHPKTIPKTIPSGRFVQGFYHCKTD